MVWDMYQLYNENQDTLKSFLVKPALIYPSFRMVMHFLLVTKFGVRGKLANKPNHPFPKEEP